MTFKMYLQKNISDHIIMLVKNMVKYNEKDIDLGNPGPPESQLNGECDTAMSVNSHQSRKTQTEEKSPKRHLLTILKTYYYFIKAELNFFNVT